MDGSAEAPAAGTVLNALATGHGAAFAIDRYTRADVEVGGGGPVTGAVAGEPDADTRLVERCVELACEAYGDGVTGGHVETDSEVSMAAGLKSSSAAANATVLATLDALGVADDVPREDAALLGVRAARDVGVTVTGAYDDASASMLGGLTVTDNDRDVLLARDDPDWDVLVWTPDEKAFSADADAERCARIAPLAEHVEELTFAGRYGLAMTINGFAFCGALDFPITPLVEAMPAVDGVSLSGTGPSYVAVGEADNLEDLQDTWETKPGTTFRTTTQHDGARTR
ncbi:shikimate kinase [Halarchaeum rubridurum]|uniref:Shikimate kinase n=1 Tax=Halarchaeum rubridurum TaxID=489911 RepID=A0A830FRI9_9EURY|nr:shikimate kinase [Halarchaeum rubridurum]MBP1953522.1 shikimate kinase [Halarchaeum rubridurum]GGM64582.1 shikimate kinase [Halarchaeum rubridurum]